MKIFLLSALFLAGASAAPADDLDKRQFSSLFGTAGRTTNPAVVLKKLQPEYKSSATHAVYMYGPFKLPPSNATHGGMGFGTGPKLDPNSDSISGWIEPPCKDCTVHKAMANFAYKDGKQTDVANGVYIHHIIIADLGGKSQIMMPVQQKPCPLNWTSIVSSLGSLLSPSASPSSSGMSPKPPSKPMRRARSKRQLGMSVFVGGGGSVGSGNPFSTRPGSNVKSGYWIGPKSEMQLSSEIINYDPVEKEIYLTLDVEWSPNRDPDMLDVGMGAINANACNAPERGILHPPKDKAIIYKGDEFDVTSEGYLINFTPHIHDGGVNIKVFVNGKEVCESRAVYGYEGGTANAPDGKKWQTITGYTPCEIAVPIKKGDKVYMTSEYDLTKHRLRPDNTNPDAEAEGMALANFIFARPFPKSGGK